jgi:hypothetical protein
VSQNVIVIWVCDRSAFDGAGCIGEEGEVKLVNLGLGNVGKEMSQKMIPVRRHGDCCSDVIKEAPDVNAHVFGIGGECWTGK